MSGIRRNPVIEHRIPPAASDSDIDAWTALSREAFAPFVRRRKVLTDLRYIFRAELINLLPITQDDSLSRGLLEAVRMCRRAIYFDRNQAHAFQIALQPALINSEMNWFSAAASTQLLDEESDLTDRVGQKLTILHTITETGLDSRVRYLYGFAHYLAEGSYPAFELTFGSRIAQWPESASPRLYQLFFDPLFGLPISQWRNISAHKDFRRIGLDLFDATYGANRERHINFTSADLESILDWSSGVQRVCRMAQTIIDIEFMKDLKVLGLTVPTMRFDQELLVLSHNLRMVGFTYSSEQIINDELKLRFRDDLSRLPRNAVIHLSQALTHLASAVDLDVALRDSIKRVTVVLLSLEETESGSASVEVSSALKYLSKASTMEEYIDEIDFNLSK